MSFILRTWGCHNPRCREVFTSGERAPACPRCGCIRVGWVPAQLNLGSAATKASDGDLRTLADMFGLSDLNSVSHSRQPQAKRLATAGNGKAAGVVNFQGFAANIDPASARSTTNPSGAQCVPTVNRIDAKVKAGMDQKLTGKLGFGSVAEAATLGFGRGRTS
jgi:hypothetical protein